MMWDLFRTGTDYYFLNNNLFGRLLVVNIDSERFYYDKVTASASGVKIGGYLYASTMRCRCNHYHLARLALIQIK